MTVPGKPTSSNSISSLPPRRRETKFRKLLICDDHPPIRTAVTYIAREINPDIKVVEAGNAVEALTRLEEHPDIDLVLLDLHMPGKSGFDLLSELKLKFPTIPVVVLSSDETRAAVVDALERGATGYICKSLPTDVLANFLEHALNRGLALPLAVIQGAEPKPTALPSSARNSERPVNLGLSPRQIEVLGCLLRGMSAKQICRELKLSEGTVKSHTIAIFRAFDVTSRVQVVIEAARRGVPIGEKPR